MNNPQSISGATPRDNSEQSPNVSAADLYQRIAIGEVSAHSIAVQDLFSLASKLAVSGKLEEKNHIFGLIDTHPSASSDDRLRVNINECDWMRRQGSGEQALAKLETLAISQADVVKAEYLQAVNQCLLQMSAGATSPQGRIDLLARACENQAALCEIVQSNGQFPADKQIYHLVGLCELRGRLMALNGQTSDALVERAIEQCASIARTEHFELPFRERLNWELPYTRGSYLRDAQRYEDAIAPLSTAWIEVRETSMDRVKAAVALECLYCSLKIDLNDDVFRETRDFYLAGGQNSLLQGDVLNFKARLEFVDQRLAAAK